MPSVWVQHVKAYYQAQKKKNPDYKYKQAMKDARATYKKKGAAKAEEKIAEAPKKRKRRKLAPKKKSPMIPERGFKDIENRTLR